ncbi:hypothetical protein Q428_07290 [Fervidicella metallireducens AeB]|uniref:YoaR-like putative peptidoglycan binding domain-containing protein n=1 Tax=Fervidicella metallireducens AeB TaxID=1403537 RepID=A0A017RW28_9CLOT|nr:VanW family protein [Fervidicella metallireducens]EYE88579.1 hypothetical protein Q428_07290 [Fervidicella metallireducens AeB]
MKKKQFISKILIYILLTFILSGPINSMAVEEPIVISQEIYVNNINIGGLTKDEAYQKLKEELNKFIEEKKINFELENISFSAPYSAFGVFYDIDSAIKQAQQYTIDRLNDNTSVTSPYYIELPMSYNENLILDYASSVSSKYSKLPVNAKLEYVKDYVVIKKEEYGINIDEIELSTNIVLAILNLDESVKVPYIKISPEITSEKLSKSNFKIAGFSTPLKSLDANRTNNIIIAANSINGYIIKPKETFSANKAFGARTKENGYKDAPIFVNGKVEPGLAGGICQLVTTLYNTVLYSDLQVIERKPHGKAVTYVSPGRDATISGNAIDFKFKNTTNYPIYIQTYVDTKKKQVTVNFYSQMPSGNTKIDISSYVYKKTSTHIYSKTYKKIYVNGKLTKTVLVSSDSYLR